VSARIGVISRFDAWTTSVHPFRKPLIRAGLEYVPIRLGDIQLTSEPGNKATLQASGHADIVEDAEDPFHVDGILWRVSENLYLPCRGLIYTLAHKYRIINSPQCIARCSDKWTTHDHLNASGLPTVRTQLLLPDSRVPYLGTPRTVVKPCFGAGGRGVRAMTPGEPFTMGEAYIAQPEIVSDPNTHVRVLVCDGSAVAAIHRTLAIEQRSSSELPVNNLDAGGRSAPADLEPVAEIATAAAEAVGGLLVGVDLVPDGDGEYMVLEVNSSPGLEGANRHSPTDVYDLASRAICRALVGASPTAT
jgi:glutathione synthase/RimK-type ligase-like ATP-grasp enzyme